AAVADTLGAKKTTGHRLELPDAALDDKGQAQWDIDLAEILSDGKSVGDDDATPHAKKGSRRHAGRVTKSEPTAPTTKPAEAQDYAGPWRLTVSASVVETGGRAVTATRQADLDPLPFYIGV